MAKALKLWKKQNIGDLRLRLQVAREVIHRLDIAQETRMLSDDERGLRKWLKEKVTDLTSLENAHARRHARMTWIKLSDTNTKFFHIKSNAKIRKKFIP